MPTEVKPHGLYIGRDLFFSSKVTGTARQLGWEMEVAANISDAVASCENGAYRCLFFDLEMPQSDLVHLMDNLPEENRPVVIAFGAHVHTERLEAARAAGCDQVMPRSRFSSELPELLRGLMGDKTVRDP